MTTPGSNSRCDAARHAPIYVTLAGLPLAITLDWPFHRSTSGADFYVLHGDVQLEGSGGLHALVAVQLTLTVREVMPSLERSDAEAPVINVLRKEADRKQLEFLKSPKRLPVAFNSRIYDFKRNRWAFARADDRQITAILKRKVYWEAKRGAETTWIADPIDAQYLDATPARLIEMAATLSELMNIRAEHAVATPALRAQSQVIESEMRAALQELERKHAFESA